MIPDKNAAKQLSGTVLAYVGDAVVEVMVRTELVSLGITDTARFNELALRFVTAKAQSAAYAAAEPYLTEEETEILKRGRNAAITHRPKNQTQSDYRRATGFEALMGYLYLSGERERAREIFQKTYISVIDDIKNKTL